MVGLNIRIVISRSGGAWGLQRCSGIYDPKAGTTRMNVRPGYNVVGAEKEKKKKKRRLTSTGREVYRSHQFRLLPTVVGLCSVFTTVGTVLPCGVGKGSLASFASDNWRVCCREEGKVVIVSWHDRARPSVSGNGVHL